MFGLSLLALQLCSAFWTPLDVIEKLGFRWSRVGVYSNHLGDDLAAFFDVNLVAYADVERFNLIGVVQGCTFHRGPCDQYGLEFSNGCNGTRSAHLIGHIHQPRRLLLRFEFVSNGPTGALGGHAQLLLLAVFIHLDDNAINGKGQIMAGCIPMGNECLNSSDGLGDFHHAIRWRRRGKSPQLG